MNKKPIVLTKLICIEEKPKTKSVIWDIIDSYPCVLELSYECTFSAGCVASIDITNTKTGKAIFYTKPHNVSRALSHVEWYEIKS